MVQLEFNALLTLICPLHQSAKHMLALLKRKRGCRISLRGSKCAYLTGWVSLTVLHRNCCTSIFLERAVDNTFEGVSVTISNVSVDKQVWVTSYPVLKIGHHGEETKNSSFGIRVAAYASQAGRTYSLY